MRSAGVKQYEEEGHGHSCKCGGEKCAVLVEWDWEKKEAPPRIGTELPTGEVPPLFAFGNTRSGKPGGVLVILGSDLFKKFSFDGRVKKVHAVTSSQA
jgi:hypothetical protein